MLPDDQRERIIAAILRREVPPELADAVQAYVLRQGWLNRLLFARAGPLMMGPQAAPNPTPAEPAPCDVVDVRGELASLHRSLVFDVRAPHGLEHHELPNGGTFGTFAVGPSGLRCLNRHPEGVAALFDDEPCALADTAPADLAVFFADVLGGRQNVTHDVLRSEAHLRDYGPEPLRGQYEVDASQWHDVRDRFVPPRCTEVGSSVRLEFCTVYGWMHDKQRLTRQQYDIDLDAPASGKAKSAYRESARPHAKIRWSEELLSGHIFRRVPGLRY